MEKLVGIKALLGEYRCSNCGNFKYFAEKIPCEKVIRLQCDHYILVVMFAIQDGIKINVTTQCKRCNKQYNSELKIGRLDSNHNLNKDDFYNSECCGNKIEVTTCLSEQYYSQNVDIKNYINNFKMKKYSNKIYNNNNIINNNSMMNNNNLLFIMLLFIILLLLYILLLYFLILKVLI